MKSDRRKLYLWLLGTLNIILIILVAFLVWRDQFIWKNLMYGMTGLAASQHATNDFNDGKLRLFMAVEGSEQRSTGKTDGPFQVWERPYHRALGTPHKFTEESYIGFYNRRMRHLHSKVENQNEDTTAPLSPTEQEGRVESRELDPTP